MTHTNIKMYGTVWCSDCKRTKKFFGERRVHYDFIDIDQDPEGLKIVEKVNEGKQIIPVLVFDDGSTLVEPSNADSPPNSASRPPPRTSSTTSSSSAAAPPASPPPSSRP
ncbi:MAG TPA: glutaredoxin domain-containing protein [Dehalococcoidia bacterium]|nr:glutaredoxin domain-containing protein [Dehalococcoidia bacterium]